MSARVRRSVSATSRPPRSRSQAAERVQVETRVDAVAQAAAAHRGDVGVQAQRELAHDRLLVQLLDALDRGQLLARVVGAGQQQLAQLDDPAPPQPAQVDDAGERVERLRGADVRGRALAADVLLAGLQREHEAAATLEVLGGAGDAAGHPAQVLLAGGEQAERRAPEVEPVAERLTLADGHVHAALAGGREHAERDRVDLGHDHRPVAPSPWRPR